MVESMRESVDKSAKEYEACGKGAEYEPKQIDKENIFLWGGWGGNLSIFWGGGGGVGGVFFFFLVRRGGGRG